jgi:hypothetical protein
MEKTKARCMRDLSAVAAENVLPFPTARRDQFKRDDRAEMARWSLKALQYRHTLHDSGDNAGPGWIKRTDDGNEHVLVCGPDGEPIFSVCVSPHGNYWLMDCADRLMGTFKTLQGAFEAIIPTLNATSIAV